MNSWSFLTKIFSVPRQENGNDCGCAVCMFMFLLSQSPKNKVLSTLKSCSFDVSVFSTVRKILKLLNMAFCKISSEHQDTCDHPSPYIIEFFPFHAGNSAVTTVIQEKKLVKLYDVPYCKGKFNVDDYKFSRFIRLPENPLPNINHVPIPKFLTVGDAQRNDVSQIASFHYGPMVFGFDFATIDYEKLLPAFTRLFKVPETVEKPCQQCGLIFANILQFNAHEKIYKYKRKCTNYAALTDTKEPVAFFLEKEVAESIINEDNTNFQQLDWLDPLAFPSNLSTHITSNNSSATTKIVLNERQRLKKNCKFSTFIPKALKDYYNKKRNSVVSFSVLFSFLKNPDEIPVEDKKKMFGEKYLIKNN